jgi:hypothetical protein
MKDILDLLGVSWRDPLSLPNGWEWQGGGEAVTFFGTEYLKGGDLAGTHGLGGYMGEADRHGIVICPVTRVRKNGDPEFGYPVKNRSSVCSHKEAVQMVPPAVRGLKQESQPTSK